SGPPPNWRDSWNGTVMKLACFPLSQPVASPGALAVLEDAGESPGIFPRCSVRLRSLSTGRTPLWPVPRIDLCPRLYNLKATKTRVREIHIASYGENLQIRR